MAAVVRYMRRKECCRYAERAFTRTQKHHLHQNRLHNPTQNDNHRTISDIPQVSGYHHRHT